MICQLNGCWYAKMRAHVFHISRPFGRYQWQAQRRVYFIQQRKIFTIILTMIDVSSFFLHEILFFRSVLDLGCMFQIFSVRVPLKFIFTEFYELFLFVHFVNHIGCLYILKLCLSKTEIINWAYFCCFISMWALFFLFL